MPLPPTHGCDMRHAMILAGGTGTRLWPLSRKRRPKQLLRLFEGSSLLQAARRRLEPLFQPENIWIVTSASYLDAVAAELPDIPRSNLLGEPVGRDTANAIGLAAHLLVRRDPEGTMAVFTADHLITPQHAFVAAIRAGLDVAEAHPDALVTFGIAPDSPHTGYGYIHRGEPIGPDTYEVRQFKEKPSRALAEEYLRSGEYFWNSGMFCWKLRTILRELERNLPENHRVLAQLASQWPAPSREGGAGIGDGPAAMWGGELAQRDMQPAYPAERSELARLFESLRAISIDFGVMEKAQRVLAVEMKCRWIDLGSWTAIAATRKRDEAGNVIIAPRAMAISGGDNVLVSESDHLLVTLGLSDLVVVYSEDVTLICHRSHEQQIRELARMCRDRYGERYE
jgi:mannose-1-phosphate guanylyltransferase